VPPPEPPDEQPPPPPLPVDPAGGECPRCGTPYEPFQEYCLECGLRLPVTHGVIPVLATAWRRRVPWYPGDWIWPALAALVVAALAAGTVILVTNDNGSATQAKPGVNETVSTGSTTNPPPTGTETVTGTGTGTETGPTTSAPTTETTAPEPAPPPPPAGGLKKWPQGQGWTVVLASIPQTSGRAAAVREARKASAAGLSEVGVLNSDDYPRLHPNYWVVFSGVYNSLQEAEGAVDTAKSTYSAAYVRQIS
jgi:hypothetical protein